MLAKTNIDEAMWLAKHGRRFSKMENCLHWYYKIFAPELTVDLDVAVKEAAEPPDAPDPFSAYIKQIFSNALRGRDAKAILEIGRAVEMMREFKDTGDHYRHLILMYRASMEKTGQTWTIRRLARRVNWPDQTGADGFSGLRRLCHEMDFPLADSRHIRRTPVVKKLGLKKHQDK